MEDESGGLFPSNDYRDKLNALITTRFFLLKK